jgi:putative ABC transport system ATP-binding protein
MRMNTNGSPLLEAKDIAKAVDGPEGRLTILHPARLVIDAGDTVAVIGPSGSGKTTLLGLLAGLDLPTEGQIFFRGSELTALDEDQRAELRSAAVGFVFQSFHLLGSLTAEENVMLPMELADEDGAEQRAREILTQVGLADRAQHYPNQLSGGEKQRVAIARAFASRPALLFADEPTGNLDTATGLAISDLLFELNQRHQTTLILVTHDERLATRCHRQIRLEAGHVHEDNPPLEAVSQ